MQHLRMKQTVTLCVFRCGENGADMYLIDNLKARMNFPTTLQAIRNMVRKHPKAHAKLVEDKANDQRLFRC